MVTKFDASPAADIELESPEVHDKEWRPPQDVNFCLSFGDDTAVRAPPGILQGKTFSRRVGLQTLPDVRETLSRVLRLHRERQVYEWVELQGSMAARASMRCPGLAMEEVNDDESVQMKVPTPGFTGITRPASTRCSTGSRDPVPVWTKTSVFIMKKIEENTQELMCVVLSTANWGARRIRVSLKERGEKEASSPLSSSDGYHKHLRSSQ